MTLPGPGEWYARKTHTDGYVTHIVSLDAEPVADEFYYGRNIAVAVSEEQAHLIAAAPDLLAACEEMLAAISFPMTNKEKAAWDRMLAAAMKAKNLS